MRQDILKTTRSDIGESIRVSSVTCFSSLLARHNGTLSGEHPKTSDGSLAIFGKTNIVLHLKRRLQLQEGQGKSRLNNASKTVSETHDSKNVVNRRNEIVSLR